MTAGNASQLSDGAAALVVCSAQAVARFGLRVLCECVAFADAAKAPAEFTTAPALAIPKALSRAGVEMGDVDVFEINEAFSVVALANAKLLGIEADKCNVYGGAVAMGHPLGCSGARIVVTLMNALRRRGGKYVVHLQCRRRRERAGDSQLCGAARQAVTWEGFYFLILVTCWMAAHT